MTYRISQLAYLYFIAGKLSDPGNYPGMFSRWRRLWDVS